MISEDEKLLICPYCDDIRGGHGPWHGIDIRDMLSVQRLLQNQFRQILVQHLMYCDCNPIMQCDQLCKTIPTTCGQKVDFKFDSLSTDEY